MSRRLKALRAAAVGLTLAASVGTGARAAPAELPDSTTPQRVGLFAAAGYLGSPGASGAELSSGLRFGFARHLAVSLDLGYGLLKTSPGIQDRWWVIPAVALVIPAGRLQFDLGLGLGVGASSGYTSWSAYAAAPFTPIWAYQLIPTLRVHAVASMELTHRVDVFARVDVASLLLGGNSLGSRVGTPNPGVQDTTWGTLSIGVQFRLL